MQYTNLTNNKLDYNRDEEITQVDIVVFGQRMTLTRRNGKFVKPAALKSVEGKGSALKPAVECWWLVRKPLSEKNLAENVLKWNCGALNIDACRISGHSYSQEQWSQKGASRTTGTTYGQHKGSDTPVPSGRFPSHLLLSHTLLCTLRGTKRVRGNRGFEGYTGPRTVTVYDGYNGSEGREHTGDADGLETVEDWECHDSCPIRILGEQSGIRKSGLLPSRQVRRTQKSTYGKPTERDNTGRIWGGDEGSAARFFQQFHPATEIESQRDMVPYIYAPKASRAERNRGCEELPEHPGPVMNDRCVNCGKGRLDGRRGGPCCDHPEYEHTAPSGNVSNSHPCVKSLQLMRYLVRLITPPGGVVLDCFAGSGSTLVSCVYEGFRFIGIDQSEEYCQIAHARVQYALQHAQMAGDGP